MSRKPSYGLAQIFAWPIVFAALTLTALIAGLLGHGALDALAVIGLGAPSLYAAWRLIGALTPRRRADKEIGRSARRPSCEVSR